MQGASPEPWIPIVAACAATAGVVVAVILAFYRFAFGGGVAAANLESVEETVKELAGEIKGIRKSLDELAEMRGELRGLTDRISDLGRRLPSPGQDALLMRIDEGVKQAVAARESSEASAQAALAGVAERLDGIAQQLTNDTEKGPHSEKGSRSAGA